MTIKIINGDCRDVLAGMPEGSIDACVTDPPYGLGFMGKAWDHGVPGVPFWAEVFRVLKPGAHLLAFGGTRTYHRLACAIEDAGFEIRDQIGWAYGSGFPKSLDVSKAIDKAAGAEPIDLGPGRFANRKPNGAAGVNSVGLGSGTGRETAPATPEAAAWAGWGTALKPAWEPICVARKPLVGTVAANVLAHGTGALNIDGCRVEAAGEVNPSIARRQGSVNHLSDRPARETEAEGRMASRQSPEAFRAERAGEALGRWPANLVHDGSDEVLSCFPETGKSAARFFYCAKASRSERGAYNTHPTVKPVALMRWLVRLVTPPGGHVLDPFAGSGTSGLAADAEGFASTLIELDAKHCTIIQKRLPTAKIIKQLKGNQMDELLEQFETYVAKYNELATQISALNATFAELTEGIQALSTGLGELADSFPEEEGLETGEEQEEEQDEDQEDERSMMPPPVCCATCAFFANAAQMCQKWGQQPPPEILPVGCPSWIISPSAYGELEPAPEPQPAAPEAPKKRGRPKKGAAPAPAAATAPKRGGKKAALADVPF